MSRPAESPGGLVKTEPALLPPGWCSRRQRTIERSSSRPAASSPRPRANSAQLTNLALGHRRAAVAVAEMLDPVDALAARGEVQPPVGDERRRGVRAVAPGVHAHGPAHRAGHADGPLHAPKPERHAPTGEDGQLEGGPGADPLGPRRPRPGGRTRQIHRSGARRRPRNRHRRRAGSSPCRARAVRRRAPRAPRARR